MAYQDITKYTSPNSTPAAQVPGVFGQPRKVKSITIHHWGNRGQRFQDVVNYLCTPWQNRPDRRQSSAHYVIEAGKSACIIDPDDAAWHSDNATGNATSIGLELRPEATDGDYQTAAEVIRDLRKVYGNVPLVPHRQWTSTACPGVWDLARLDRLARGTVTTASTKPKPATTAKESVMAETPRTEKYLDAKVSEVLAVARNVRDDGPRKGWAYPGTEDRDMRQVVLDVETKLDEVLNLLKAGK